MAPHINTISPTSGAVGSNVQLNGTNFIDSGEFFNVYFNGTIATQIFTYNTTTIVVRVPVGATTGPLMLRNPNTGHQSNSITFTVTASVVPHINTLTPNNGGIGISVVIAGTNFGATQGTSTVKFNGTLATVQSWSATSITVTVPSMATTGNVVVTTVAGASNGVLFTITNPSNGGIGSPLGLLLIPVTQFFTPVVLTFDTTNFDDVSNASVYSWKVEEVIAGRNATCNRQVIQYRDLGVATISANLTAINENTKLPEIKSETFQIGTVSATGKIVAIVRGLTKTGLNLQYSIIRGGGAGPLSIVKVQLSGEVEAETAYS